LQTRVSPTDGTMHDAIWRSPAHRLEAYSPKVA
jgi:hypothetical protein